MANRVVELQKIRDLHAKRSAEFRKFALTIVVAGTGVVMGILAAAEEVDGHGNQSTLYLHWFIPFVIIAVWSFDIRFRIINARDEELMQRIYTKEIEAEFGPGVALQPHLGRLRDKFLAYHSPEQKAWRSAYVFVIQFAAHLPLTLIFLWSLVSVVLLDRGSPPWQGVMKVPRGWFNVPLDRLTWIAFIVSLSLAVFGIRVWKSCCFRQARRELGELLPRE